MVAKPELSTFYDALDSPAERALFLLYAASGRRLEILNLKLSDLDLANRLIMPNSSGRTKHT
jgi:integrase